ncbi:MAG: hypothetical protein K6E63_07705 [Lachnospiraceae bacterium]|nr:hypothetical protein [Lachnospiraceae bacterium]
MKNLRFSAAVLAAVLMMSSLCGCGSKAQHWAYNHEPGTEVLTLYDNGKAVFEGKDYTYVKDASNITLTAADGTVTNHRYELDGEEMKFYKPAVYTREAGSEGEGIIGKWVQDNGRNLFEFTKEGQFNEDGYFYGHYTVKENEGTIKLMYVDPLQDTLLYYSLDNDKITIEYPWTLVPVSDKQNEKGQTTVPATTGN